MLWVCVCELFLWYVSNFPPLPPLTYCTTLPICLGPDSCCILSVFLKHRNTLSAPLPEVFVIISLGQTWQWCCWVNCFVVSASLMPTWPLEGPYKSQASVCAACWHILTHTTHLQSQPKMITDYVVVVSIQKSMMDISGISLSSLAPSRWGV